ncbi:efflux RND transporter permease subunit [Glaciecola sp. KUL10]|uniref:efflux RND transporter permease subunit n=1 Tax=Glaciecola sp. (strain KUL10) TaxID=2161813 RepID=UPI000D786464|nr:CusA/CzcA family heavy metal efflux RND transporter [Glaciecola sp. KUL10]GBL04487.1 cation efflux system protein CusA [Glaciecola sp. KUL10]
MIEAVIRWSIKNRVLVILLTVMLSGAGFYSIKSTAVDAIPDLSDVQVIVKTSYAGQAPQVVEDQVTYPLTTALLAVPGAKTVRGFSFFGDSYVYVIFEDGTDLYWARSRVLEYLSQVSASLPDGVNPQLGPDATGVGWVYMYALDDRSGKRNLSELRSLQDWFLKFELQTVEGVSEIATVGGMVKQYQVIVDPIKLQAFGVPLSHVQTAIQRGNQELGASVIEMAEAEYMIRTSGYIENISQLENIPIGVSSTNTAKHADNQNNQSSTPLLLKDIADIRLGPQMRRGVAELNGEGETVGGIVVMRAGENAQDTIKRVQEKLANLQKGLPEGVEVVTVYDRSTLINAAVDNLNSKILMEFAIVALVCVLFLFHVRSALVAIISLPIGILIAFIIMKLQGINANIMSLGGIAIAIGAMIDGAIVLVENMHKHLQRAEENDTNRWELVAKSASEVGPSLFFSLLIITVSFLPVFTLEAQEGKLFAPLAYTKTYAMAAAALLAITLVPVLMGYFVKGKILAEDKNPLNKALIALYKPALRLVLRFPKTTVLISILLLALTLIPASKIGSEFIPPLDEGDLMYMPTTYASVSVGKAREILQQTNKLIKTVPEVQTVFGKVGRAETATDPAPLTMIETFIQLKPRSEWREGVSTDSLIKEFDALVDFPGLTNAWVMPIKTRIDMLSTGIKTPLGLKIAGSDLNEIQSIGKQIEQALSSLEGTASVYAERVADGRYLNIDIDRQKAARFGLSIADIQTFIASAVGGVNMSKSVERLERYPIQLRFEQTYRDSPQALSDLPMTTQGGAYISLGDVADISISEGPAGIKSENARPNAWVYIDINDVDIAEYVSAASNRIDQQIKLPAGYSITWSGQYEYMQRAQEKLTYVLPLTLGIIVLLLYMNFKSLAHVLMILGTVPFSLLGGVVFIYLLDFNFSVAVAVGFIALAGVAVEIGIIMLSYLDTKFEALKRSGDTDINSLIDTVTSAALLRIRPVMMTSTSIIFGLIPVIYSSGAGSEVMSRIAAPLVGGMVSALILSLLVLPAVYYLWRRWQI